MQFQQLAYFVAVARTGHVTRAAAQVDVAQPTVSKQIRALENSLGVPLFIRTPHGVELSSAGVALLPHAKRIVLEVESARRSVQEVADLRRGRVRLGATPSICEGLVPDALRAFRSRHPKIELVVREGSSGRLRQDLADGQLDVALLIASAGAADPNLTATPVLRERLVLASSTTAPVPEEIAVADLPRLPLVAFRQGYDLRDVTNRALARAGVSPTIAMEGGDMGGVLRFVETGFGHAVVPGMVIATRPGLQASRIVNPALERVIAIAHPALESLPLTVRAFIDELREHLRGIDSAGLAVV